MKCTGSHWRAGIELLAWLIAAGSVWPLLTAGSTRPQYGGTLRIELPATEMNLDPREWKPGAPEFSTDERIAALVFDRLVSLDNYGRFQPELATDWTHDASFKQWQFTLRSGVKFSDGTVLTPADAVAALQALLPAALQVTASGGGMVIQASSAVPDMLEILASGRFFIFRAAPDGTLAGTGPFTVAERGAAPTGNATAGRAVSTQKLRLVAFETCWAGRPFVDAIEITLGVPPLRAMYDVQLAKADLAMLSPEMGRRAAQSNLRVWSSAPLTLYALQFGEAQRAPSNAALREALALSLDRATMAGVLLQKQAEPAGALLPEWLSGYASVFTVETDVERAQELRSALPAGSPGGAGPLYLRANVSGDLAKLLAERVMVNARRAGFSMQLASRAGAHKEGAVAKAGEGEPALQLFAWRYTSLSPRVELNAMVTAVHAEEGNEITPTAADPERLCERERRLLKDKQIVPLVLLPDYVALNPAVRDWLPASWGEWHLADVWLERTEKSPGNPGGAAAAPGNSSGAYP